MTERGPGERAAGRDPDNRDPDNRDPDGRGSGRTSDPAPGQPARQRREPDRARLARQALQRAKADSLAKGNRPTRPPGLVADGAASAGTSSGPPGSVVPASGAQPPGGVLPPSPTPAPSTAPARPGRRERRDDPQPLTAAISSLIGDYGWTLAAATGSVFGRWAEIVGPELAAHTKPESLADGELTIAADSTAWATQLRLLAAQLVRRLNAELGDGSVRRVKVRGPVAAARRPGEWRVRGSRGPRDTYG